MLTQYDKVFKIMGKRPSGNLAPRGCAKFRHKIIIFTLRPSSNLVIYYTVDMLFFSLLFAYISF